VSNINTRTYVENFVRTPTKGLRTKLRTELRARGVTGKFGTDEMRDGRLRVKGNVSDTSLTMFDGHPVYYVLEKKNDII